jgi:hypothetical protein
MDDLEERVRKLETAVFLVTVFLMAAIGILVLEIL